MLSWKRREKLDSENRFVFCASISYASGLFYRCFASAGKTMELLDQMLKIVPLYKMKCDISKEAFECSFGAMTFGKWKLQ